MPKLDKDVHGITQTTPQEQFSLKPSPPVFISVLVAANIATYFAALGLSLSGFVFGQSRFFFFFKL